MRSRTDRNVTEHRVQVNFPDYLYQLVRKEAFRKNASISGFIRDTIKITFDIKDAPGQKREVKWNKLLTHYVGAIKGKPDDSISHDKWAHKTATFNEK